MRFVALMALAAGGLVAADADAEPLPVREGDPTERAEPTTDQGVSAPESARAATTAAPAPTGLGQKQHLTDEDYARKNEGGYFTGLPLANYDPNTGFGLGARGYYYNNGTRDNPLFAYTPYLHRVIVQAYASTRGVQNHLVDYDAPNFLGSLFRVRTTLEYEGVNARTYYGIGARAMHDLAYPGAPGKFPHASDYEASTSALRPDGTTYAQYNYLKTQRPLLQLALERLFLGGVLRPLVGFAFAYNKITDYSGTQINAIDGRGNTVQATAAQSFFAADCAAQRIVGCGGGWDNVLRLAVSVDTRDFEPDPNSGLYAEFSNELASKALGSDYDYVRTMLSVRGFFSPIPKLADLVLAGRVVYEIQSSGTPWFSMNNLPFLDDNHFGLGGFRTLRGYKQDRFVGPVMGLGNAEVRWTFTHFKALNQKFALIAVPFIDVGRVWDRVSDTSFKGFKHSQGGGLRIAWNEATIIMIDYGFSREDTGLYINFNHIF